MIRRLRMAVLLSSVLVACGRRTAVVPTRSIDEVLATHADSLMTLPGVVGTAIGLCEGERCIKVFLADSNAATKRRIPDRLEGYRVLVEVIGTIKPR